MLKRRAGRAILLALTLSTVCGTIWLVAAAPLPMATALASLAGLVIVLIPVALWSSGPRAAGPGGLAQALWANIVPTIALLVVWGTIASLVTGSLRPFVAAWIMAGLLTAAIRLAILARQSPSWRARYYRADRALLRRGSSDSKSPGRVLKSPGDFEFAARRGFVDAALANLEAMASAEPVIGNKGRETSTSLRRRARSRIHRAFILDQTGRFSEGDVEARLAHQTDPAMTYLRDRAGARIVSMYARAGEDDRAVSAIRHVESEEGFVPRLEIQRLAAPTSVLRGDQRLEVLNDIYRRAGFPTVGLRDATKPVGISNLRGEVGIDDRVNDGPLVTVAVPCFNSEDSIDFVLETLLDQTYRRLEVIVVDDASTDDTCARVDEWIRRDDRVTLLRNETNSGAYVSRNRALAAARGEYFMVRDADDWAHPSQVATLVRGMLENGDRHGAIVDHVRASQDLVVRGPATNSTASLMIGVEFARSLGGWHEVRIGADSEFIERCKRACGADFVVSQAPWVPLVLAFVGDTNLTTDGPRAVRYVRHVAGVRSLYHESAERWRSSPEFTGSAGPAVPASARKFVVPRLMDPLLHGATPHDEFDVVMVADFACTGERAELIDAELATLADAGLRLGLIGQPRFPEFALQPMRERVWEHVDGERVRFVTVGERVASEVLWVSDIRTGAYLTNELPHVEATRALVGVDTAVAANPPREALPYADIPRNLETLNAAFNATFVVAPRGARARALLGEGPHASTLAGATHHLNAPARLAAVRRRNGGALPVSAHVPQFIARADRHGVHLETATSRGRRALSRAVLWLPWMRRTHPTVPWSEWFQEADQRAEILDRAGVLQVAPTMDRPHASARVITDAILARVPVVAGQIGELVVPGGYLRADTRRTSERAVDMLLADLEARARLVAQADALVSNRMSPQALLRALDLSPVLAHNPSD